MEETRVTNPNLGKKQTCQSCETRFFDLNKNPAICPKCGYKNKISITKPRRTLLSEPKAHGTNTAKEEELAEDANLEEIETKLADSESENETDELEAELEDTLDDSLMENTSELDEDSDELSAVFERANDDDNEK
jgi:uncharacterized protein (TIGR02300 family)